MSEALRATGATRRSTVVLTTRAPASAVRAVATDLDSWRAGGAVVITPGPLAARALGVAHRSLTDLALAVLAGRGIRFAGALTRRAALQAAVEDTWSVDDVAGTARSVESTVRELLTAGTGAFVEGGPMIDLDARAHRASAMADYPRLGRLIDLVAAYRRHLTAEAVVDRAEALWLAAADASPEGPRATLVVCGYPLLAPAELAFVTAYAAAGSLLVLPQAHGEGARTPVSPDSFAPNEEAAAELAARGWHVVRDAGDATNGELFFERVAASSGPKLAGYRLASIDAEVRFVLTTVKELLLQGTAAADIVLVAPDPASYGPVVTAVGREYGVAVRPSYTVPLALTPLGYLVGSIAGVVSSGLPFEETARLLSHHLVRPLSPEAWNAARLQHPAGLRQWERFDARVTLLDWPRRATRAEYTALLETALEGLGAFDPLVSDPAESSPVTSDPVVSGAFESGLLVSDPVVTGPLVSGPHSSRHLELLFASLSAYASFTTHAPVSALPPLAMHVDRAGAGSRSLTSTSVTLAAFVGELLDHLQLVTVGWSDQVTPRADGVALVAASAVAGAVVSHLFVLGAAEGAVPARLDPGARLDFVEREVARGVGLPVTGAAQAARGQALTFDAIMRAARESVTLSFPESGERDGQLPSPYFAALDLTPTAPGAQLAWAGGRKPAASIEELRRHLIAAGAGTSLAGDRVLAAARHAVAVESLRESAEPPDEYDGIVGEPYPSGSQPFSATSLSSLGQCAFRWFAQYGLRLHEPEEASEELSPLVRGNLYHQTLQFAFEAAGQGGAPTRAGVLAALPAAFARAEDEEARYTVNWQHHRGQHLATLRRVVRAESFLPEGTEVVGSETLFGYGEGGPATWRGFDVRGRIDRIDRRHGVLTLVDYKTSSSKPLGVQNAAGDAKVDLQLPIYLEAAVPALGLAGAGETGAHARAHAPVDAEYYSLTKARAIWSTSSSGEDAYDSAGLAHFAERAHAALAEGHYPVRPDRERKVCGYCAFDSVCRVGPRVERKRSVDG